jgi:hypothetical protein
LVVDIAALLEHEARHPGDEAAADAPAGRHRKVA